MYDVIYVCMTILILEITWYKTGFCNVETIDEIECTFSIFFLTKWIKLRPQIGCHLNCYLVCIHQG